MVDFAPVAAVGVEEHEIADAQRVRLRGGRPEFGITSIPGPSVHICTARLGSIPAAGVQDNGRRSCTPAPGSV